MIGFDQKPEQQNKELKMRGATLNLSDECVFTEWAVAGRVWNCPGYHGVWVRHAYAKECRAQASWPDSKRSTEVFRTHQGTGHSIAGNPSDEDSHEVVIIDTREYAR